MVIYVDGGARGNPGPAAIGFVVFDDSHTELYRFGAPIGVRTNNYAEYSALIEALTYLRSKNTYTETVSSNKPATIYSDSELIVRQMNGEYKVKEPKLIPLHSKARGLLDQIDAVRIHHIRRKENRIADAIVNRVLDNREMTGQIS